MSLHKDVRNISSDAEDLTENQLNISQRPWTLESTKKILDDQVGQKKEEKKKRGSGMGSMPLGFEGT